MAKALRRAHRKPAAAPSKKKQPARGKQHHKAPAHASKPRQTAKRAPNILITIDERHRSLAGDEILTVLDRAGYPKAEITVAPGTGLVGVYVECDDPRACIPKLKAVLLEAPFAFQHTHRWLPVESWAAPDAAELEKFAKLAGAEIGHDASWGIVVERHNSNLDRGLIVNTLAKEIDNPHVSLDAPEKTLFVEVVGNKAAMAVLRQDEQLSVDKSMREDFVQFEEVKPSKGE